MYIGKPRLKIKFEYHDLWVGAYWRKYDYMYTRSKFEHSGEGISATTNMHIETVYHHAFDIYICLLPSIVINLKWKREHINAS